MIIFYLNKEKTNKEILALEIKYIPFKIYFGILAQKDKMSLNYIKISK